MSLDAPGLTVPCVLTLNGGSSSLKCALFKAAQPGQRLASGAVKRIGLTRAEMVLWREGEPREVRILEIPDHARALTTILEALLPSGDLTPVAAVGHRLVHGGPSLTHAQLVTADVLAELRRWIPLDPDHLPAEITIVETMLARAPSTPQVACFDTAFHRSMPRVACLLPIPRRYESAGVRRYGFHGLSYAYLMQELARVAGTEAARGRVVLAHLGSGASLAAVRAGQCVDTTMGFTPTGGIMMGTRAGDLDPGVLLYLARSEGMSIDALGELLNARCGLLGVSETSSDMRDLLEREARDERAREAIALFCHQTRKAIGALAATLGGLDTLVFSAGIGESAPTIRARIAIGLEHLGVHVDQARNDDGATMISPDGSPCSVRVIPTDEETMIARETLHVLHKPRSILENDHE